MSEDSKNNIRLSKAAKEFNIGMSTIIEFLGKKGYKLDSSPNTKLNGEMYALLVKEYQGEKEVKKNADQLGGFSYKGKSITVESTINKEAEDFDDETVSIRITNAKTEDKAKTPHADKAAEKKEQVQEEVKSVQNEKQTSNEKPEKETKADVVDKIHCRRKSTGRIQIYRQ